MRVTTAATTTLMDKVPNWRIVPLMNHRNLLILAPAHAAAAGNPWPHHRSGAQARHRMTRSKKSELVANPCQSWTERRALLFYKAAEGWRRRTHPPGQRPASLRWWHRTHCGSSASPALPDGIWRLEEPAGARRPTTSGTTFCRPGLPVPAVPFNQTTEHINRPQPRRRWKLLVAMANASADPNP